MAYKLQLKRGLLASLPNGSVGEPLFTTDTFDLYVGKGDGTNVKLQKFIASGSSSQFLKGDGSLDSTTYQGVLSGTGIVKSTGGTISYLTDNSANWDAAYNDKINSASVTGTTTKTLTLTQQDGGTITASWSDYDTAPVTSVFGRTGDVVAVNGDYTTSLVTEGTNLYYTDARARAAITLTTTGSSGSATYVGGTLNIPIYTLAGLGGVATSRSLTINGTSYDLSADRSWSVGTVTSVDMSVPTGFAISGNPITSSGTLALAFATGYSLPTNASQTNWDAAYNDKINSASVTGTTTKTLTLNQQDGGTITASWTDINTDAVTSVFGRTGAVVAASGDYTTTQVTEGTNLYFTNARAIASTLTGYVSGAGTITSADSILSAIQKLNGNIGALVTGVSSVNGFSGAVTLTTTNIAEGTNLYYTDTRSRAALSFTAGSGGYNSTTGVITIPTNTNQLTNGASFITLASLSGSAPIQYNNTTGVISITQASSSTSGFLSSTDWNTFNNKQPAGTYVNSVTASAPLSSSGGVNPNITISQANSTTNGFLSSTDWNTFNNKQATITLTTTGTSGAATLVGNTLNIPQYQSVITNPVTGTGTTNYLPKFTGTSTIGNSVIQEASNNIGIGFSPSYKFDVNNVGGSSATARLYGNDQANVRLRLENVGAGGRTWELTGGLTGADNSAFTIYDVTSAATRLQINTSGNLGLGVTPSAWLNTLTSFQIGAAHLFGQTTGSGTVSLGNNNYLNSSIAWIYQYNGKATRYGQYDGQHEWYTAPSGTAGNAISFTQAMTLDASGRLGIGTTSPNVYGVTSARTSDSVYYQAQSGSVVAYYGAATAYGTAVAGTFSNHAFGFYTNSSERMIISTSGNVGIGTSSPGQLLTVNGGDTELLSVGSSSQKLYFRPDGAGVMLSTATGQAGEGIYFNNVSDYIYFQTATTERMRITSGGNVGIGTTSPSYKFHVYNNTNGFISRFTGGISSDVNIGLFGNTGLGFGSIGTESNHSFNLFTNGVDRIKISAAGATEISSYTGIGVAPDSSTMVLVKGANTSSTNFAAVFQNSAGTNLVRFFNNGKVNFGALPTSSAGLSSGDLWNDGGTLKIV